MRDTPRLFHGLGHARMCLSGETGITFKHGVPGRVMNQSTAMRCPHCRKPVVWENNPDRPFCCERCRMIDLGRWADEAYRIPEPVVEAGDPDNIVSLEERRNKDLKGRS